MSDPTNPTGPEDATGGLGDQGSTPHDGGGTPPPPPSSPYGGRATPPPPPPAAYGTPYGGPPAAGGYTATGAIGYGWNKFFRSPATLLVQAGIFCAVVAVSQLILHTALRTTILAPHPCVQDRSFAGNCEPNAYVTILASTLAGMVLNVIGLVLSAGMIKSALDVVDGRPVETKDIVSYAGKSEVLVTAALVSVATFIGTLLCYIPGLVVGYLLGYTMFFVVDKGMPPREAIRASFSFTTSNFWQTSLFYSLGVGCVMLGVFCLFVGILVAIAILLIGAAYTFRRLQNEPVTPSV